MSDKTSITLKDNLNLQFRGASVLHRRLPVNDHAFLSLTKAHTNEQTDFINDFEIDKRNAALHFILNGRTHFSQNSSVPPANFSGDKCNLMLIQGNKTHQVLEAKGDFMMASFYVDLEKFTTLLGTATEALPVGFKKAIYKNTCSCNNFRWNPAVYKIILQLLSLDPARPSVKLFLESKLLELIAIILEADACDYANAISITKTDKEKIHFACELLLQNMQNPPSLHLLARKASTNEFTLKKGFKEIYGKPVYQYLLQRRMEKAMELLMSSKIPVSEIGLHLGYEDASAFTRAFTRYFHQNPTDVRRYS